jgi:putative ABC transport system permease protein
MRLDGHSPIEMLSDLWHAARSLSRARGLTVALVTTIGLGVGSQSSIDAFVRGLIGGNTRVTEPERVVSLFERDAKGAPGALSFDRYLSLKAHADLFESVGAARESEALVALRDRSTVMSAAAITPDLARILGLTIKEGVLVSHRLWETELGASEVRGESIVIDGRESRVGEIAPEWLDGMYLGRAVDVWAPLDEPSLHVPDRVSRTFWVIARLHRGVTIADAAARVNAIRRDAGELVVRPYTRMTPETAAAMSRIAAMLAGAGAAVFLIACANVASFLLARAASRSVETAVRVAIGASRGRLARLLVSESLVLSAAGGAAGFVLAWWTKDAIPILFYDQDAEQLLFAPEPARLAFVATAGMAAMAVCGLMPLVRLRRDTPASVLQRDGAGPTPTRARLLDGLVVAQVACCCLLVVSAGLLFQGFRTALHAYAPPRLGEPILATVRARVFESRGQTADAALAYFDEVEQTALAIDPIFQGVWLGAAPGSRPAWRSVIAEPPHLPTREVTLTTVPWAPALLSRLRMPPIAGRMFGGADRAGCPGVVVNVAAAAALFDGDAVGRVIYDPAGQRLEVIGVVEAHDPPSDTPDAPMVYYESDRPDLLPGPPGTLRFRVPVPPPPVTALVDATVVSPNYFSAMAVAPLAGHLFEGRRTGGCRVGVINEVGSERLFGGDAVGGAVIEPSGRRTDIIGVARAPFAGAWQRSTEPAIYLPMAQDVIPRMTIVLASREPAASVVALVRERIAGVRGAAGVPDVTTLAAYLSAHALAQERIATTLVGASAALGVALSVVGLYGAMADAGRRRRREIALRLALGAQRWRIVRDVVVGGARLAAAGAAAGLAASLLVARWITGVAGSSDSLPVWVWLTTPIVLAIAVAVASIVPARRAMAVDPLGILRER